MKKEEIEALINIYEDLIETFKDDKIFAMNSGEKITINAKIDLLEKVITDLENLL